MRHISAILRTSAPALFFCFIFVAPATPSFAQESPPVREIKLPDTALVRDPALPAWNSPVAVPPNQNSSPVYIRLADTQIHADVHSTALIHRVIAANDSSALGDVGQYQIVFQPDYEHVVLHAVNILRDGHAIDQLANVKIRFVQQEHDADNGVFTGWVTAVVVADDLRVGDSLEVQYSVIGENPVFKGRYFDAGSWSWTVPTALRRFSTDMPASLHYQYRMIGAQAGDSEVKPEVSIVGGRRVQRFIAHDLPAVDVDQYAPSDVSALRWLQFSEFSTWGEVVNWAVDLFKAPPLPKEFEPVLAQIRSATTDEGKILKALDFVQNDIRYVSMALGENSHRPFLPQEVLARRYGDCKDKSLLLVSLLREIGVEAYPVLVATENRRNLDTLLPSPLDFDHAIVKIVWHGKSWIVDPTLRDQYGSLDVLGDAHPSTWMLVVQPGNDKLMQTPPPNNSLITSSQLEEVTLSKMDQPAEMEITMQFAGLAAEQFRTSLRTTTPEQLRKFYTGFLDRRYSSAELTRGPDFNDDRNTNQFKLSLHYRIPHFVDAAASQWAVRYQASNLTALFYLPNSARRTTPLSLPSYPFIGKYEFRLTLPEEFDAKRRPFDRTLQGNGFNLIQNLSMNGRTATAKLEMDILTDRVATDKVTAFLDDIRTVNTIVGSSFVVDKNDLKIASQPSVPFKQATRERLDGIVKATSDQIANSRVSGVDIADTYCERALARADLGQAEDAITDAQTATRQQPGATSPLRCLSTVQFVTGALQASYSGYSRVIALGEADFDVFFQRGLSLHYLHRYQEASDDFARAEALTAVPADQARAEYWRVLSLARSQHPVSTAKHFTGWPGPAVALLDGSETPENLLKTLQAENSGNGLDAVLSEAYLFVGQYYQLHGETLKSRAYLLQAVDKGALFSLMHHAAKRELQP